MKTISTVRLQPPPLAGVSTNYTPGGVKSFADGSPTQITMALSFKETELLTKDMVQKGY